MSKLEERNALKKKKPNFSRQDHNLRTKFESGVWRKPKGMHSKRRRNKDGHQNMPSIGYGSPTEVKGLNAQGFERIIVNNVKGLEGMDSKKQVVIIASSVGAKKRIMIIEAAKKLGLQIKSLKDVESYVKKIKEKYESSKKERLTKKEQREKSRQAALKKKETEEKKEATSSKDVDEKKDQKEEKIEKAEEKTVTKKVVKKKVVKKGVENESSK